MEQQSQGNVSEKASEATPTALIQQLLEPMLLIRRFEERVLQLFDEGILFGTTHCYIGQEANAVGVLRHLKPTDIVWSNHRSHGHYLAFTGDAEGLMAELMGKAAGIVGGRGGTQHLCRSTFFSNGVLAGTVPAALGMAFAEKHKSSGNMVTVFMGDGTLGEGVVYECMNIASLWQLPILFVIENNRYAQSTPWEKQVAGSIPARPRAFGIETSEIALFDALEISRTAGPIVEQVRNQIQPRALVIHGYRFCHHSKSDDFRDPEEVRRWMVNDPIELLRKQVLPAVFENLDQKARDRVHSAETFARQAPFPTPNTRWLDAGLPL